MRTVDDPTAVLQAAREAHRQRDWPRAREAFVAAREALPLSGDDLDALADATWWLGQVDEFVAIGDAAFRRHLDADQPGDAAMTALGVGVSLLLRGDEAEGSGWIGRAARLLEGLPEGPEHGYIRYVTAVEGGLGGGDLQPVAEAAREVQAIGRRHDDPTLVAAGIVGEGRALVRRGEVDRGLRLLDEAMIAVLHQDLDPEWAGNVYCHLMAACHELADVGRAREWTEATSAWLSTLPAAVLFTGICRVHRSQVLQVAGQWDRAEQEAARVLEDLAEMHVASVAEAHYQLGELRRLRGDLDGAQESYGRARRQGRDPQPGAALLLHARGRPAPAMAAIRAALHAAGPDRLARVRLVAAQVEIALAVDDLATARGACSELEATAARCGTSGLEAAALHWRGAVSLAAGHAEEALPALRAACRRWNEVSAPYDAARTCVLLGRVYDALGDREASAAELAAAGATFERLGAVVDQEAVASLTGDRAIPGGLTEREVEVLALVAAGGTNREVAAELVLSEKTVARHLANIFVKLDVSTRTEAAAFAFTHGLVRSGPA